MKKIVLLGSSGSIGSSALKVVSSLPKDLSIVGLAVNTDYRSALKQAELFGIHNIAVADELAAARCSKEASGSIRVYSGPSGVAELAALDEADMVLCAIVGIAGLQPVLEAVNKGKDVALATKEVLVSGGNIVTAACARTGAKLIPVDSEHNAVLQCMSGALGQRSADDQISAVRRLILTASGGPFYRQKNMDLSTVTPEQALNHPNWSMGSKVTIDSATLMNKGLEVIEAQWMFNMPVDRIDVVVHPQSIVHSMVEFVDGSILAQMSKPDMMYAIQYALTYPDRLDGGLSGLDISALSALSFEKPDMTRFPCLRLAREAAKEGGTMPVVMNAANEVAVSRFLDGRISFPGIWETIEEVMDKHEKTENPGLDDIISADSWARAVIS